EGAMRVGLSGTILAWLALSLLTSCASAPPPKAMVDSCTDARSADTQIALCTAAIQQAGNDKLRQADAYYARGTAYDRLGKQTEMLALDDYTAAIRLNPDLLNAHKRRADLYSRLG